MNADAQVRPDARWYLVHAKTGREALAEDQLRRQGYRTFLPLLRRLVRHARKVETRRSAFFPGYLFVELNLENDRWRPVNSTVGVVRLVAAQDRPLAAPHGLVEALMARTGDDDVVDLAQDLSVGDAVSVTDGPFAGQFGVIEQLRGPARVKVLLGMMNGALSVEISTSAVAPT